MGAGDELMENPEPFLSCNLNDVCRVCLVPTATKKNSNLFFAAGRSVQLWAKVMACAWVQVFEGDGLPSQICYKCHNRLDIAYQFKQQCEAADAQMRRFISRTVGNKGVQNPPNIIQNPPECLAECKPLNFNITNECLDLVNTDLSMPPYRISNQDVQQLQHTDFRLRDSDLAALKQEPGFVTNAFNPLTLMKNDCQSNSAFKCESFNENDIILDNISDKLFESVNESMTQDGIINAHVNSSVWEPQHKTPSLLDKDDFIFNTVDCHKDKDDITKNDMVFLSEGRADSPLESANMLPDVCSDTSSMDIDNECSFGNSVSKAVSSIVNLSTDDIATDSFDKPSQDLINDEILKKPDDVQLVEEKKKPDDKEEEESDIQCEHCGKLFKYRSFMIQHLRTHNTAKPYKCTHCDQKFSKNTTLVIHLRTHSDHRPFICTICGKGFKQSNSFKSHLRSHTGEKPFECDVCSKRFSQKSNLLSHKKIHTGQRNHICSVCNKSFKLFKHLQSHKSLHLDKKDFECSICHKSFRRKSHLTDHLDVHSGLKPFKCTVCGRGFSNPSNLRAHCRIHSGSKPYSCNICMRKFTQSSALNRHKQHHNNAMPA